MGNTESVDAVPERTMGGDTSEIIKQQGKIIQQLRGEIDLLEDNIRILKTKNTDQAREYTLLYQIHTLTQENEKLASELTMIKEQNDILKTDNCEKDEVVVTLKMNLDTLLNHLHALTQENEKLASELTMIKEQTHLLKKDNCEKDEVVLQLKMKLDAQETRQARTSSQETREANTSSQETQTDRDDLANHDEIHSPVARSSYVDYSHNITDTWNTIFIQRPPGAEPPGISNSAFIQVYNFNMLTWYCNAIDSMHSSLLQLRPGEKIYYHGSNDHNVKNILENGIDVTRSTRAIDFSCGGGFYVTKNCSKAVEWSRRVVGWKRGRRAVIAFKINQSLRKEEPHLSLKVNSITNRKWWECVVSHCRHGGRSADVRNTLKDVKFIKGRVANNRCLGDEETPNPFGFTQLCIRQQEYARRFGSLQNIAFVLFDVL